MRFSAFRLFVSVWKSWNDDKFFAELEAEDERWNFVCARIFFFFLSPFSPPLSLIFWSTRHRYHPFAKGFSMKEYQHYHGDTLISEVPHSWRNTSIKVSEPRLWNLLVYYKMLWALAHQPSFQRCNQLDSVFDPEKYFHRMIHILRAHWLCQIFFRIFYPGVYSWRKKKRKKEGRISKCNIKQFPLNFRWDLVWKKYSIWKRGRRTWGLIKDYQTYFLKREERKLGKKILQMVEFILPSVSRINQIYISHIL